MNSSDLLLQLITTGDIGTDAWEVWADSEMEEHDSEILRGVLAALLVGQQFEAWAGSWSWSWAGAGAGARAWAWAGSWSGAKA